MGAWERAKELVTGWKKKTEAQLVNEVFNTPAGKELLERWYTSKVLCHKPTQYEVGKCDLVLATMELARMPATSLEPHPSLPTEEATRPQAKVDTDFEPLEEFR